MTHEQTRGLLRLVFLKPEACDDVARFTHTRFSGQGNEARMPTLPQHTAVGGLFRVALAQHFDLQEAGLVFPTPSCARELIAPGNQSGSFTEGLPVAVDSTWGMGQRLQAQLELLGRRGLPLLD